MDLKWKDCTTKAEQWAWHAQLYAFRRVALSVPVEEQTSPADPTGEWFTETLVRAAAERLQAKRRPRREHGGFSDPERAERAEYARLKAYPSWASFLDAVHDGDERIRDFVAWAEGRRSVTTPATAGTFTKAGDALRHKQEVAA